MATVPMRVTPGELLTTTENIEDVNHNVLWRVPKEWNGSELSYGDLMTVVACELRDSGFLGETMPTWVLHHRSQRVLYFEDIEAIGWVFRPSEEAVAWRKES